MRVSSLCFVSVLFPALALCQWPAPHDVQQPGTTTTTNSAAPPQVESKRIFGIIPNFRTSPSLQNYKPLRPAEKFKIAGQDSFDRGTVALAALFAGQSQLTDATPSFGQGVAGYARYFATAYADFVIGNYMTEGIYPTLLHQDPRYFRKGTGSGRARLGYAVKQIFWTVPTKKPKVRDEGGSV